MARSPDPEVPEGAAFFPPIPAQLGVDPLLLAVIHATVFLAGSDDNLVNQAAAEEAVEAMGGYLRRLTGKQLAAVHEDMECLVSYARREKWPAEFMESLRSLLRDYGVEEHAEAS
jgi:hypothetical protein